MTRGKENEAKWSFSRARDEGTWLRMGVKLYSFLTSTLG
jgi:hypothetical protein